MKYESFRVHSTPPKIAKINNIVLQSKIINNRTKNISFKFPLARVNFSLHSHEIKHTGTNVRCPVSVFIGDTVLCRDVLCCGPCLVVDGLLEAVSVRPVTPPSDS